MAASNAAVHKDVFTMGPGTKRSVYADDIIGVNANTTSTAGPHIGMPVYSISRAELHGPIRAKVREGCRRRIPEPQQGVLLLKVGEGFHQYSALEMA